MALGRITDNDMVKGVFYLLGIVLPLLAGQVYGRPALGGFALLGSMLALSLDPHARARWRVTSVLVGGILVAVSAFIGETFEKNAFISKALVLLFAWFAGLVPPQFQQLNLLCKFMATGVLLVSFGFGATLELGVAFLVGVLVGVVLSMIESTIALYPKEGTSALAEFPLFIHEKKNNVLFALTLPAAVLASSLLARQLSFSDPAWVGMTVLYVMHINEAMQKQKIMQRFIGTLVGAILVFIILSAEVGTLVKIIVIAGAAILVPCALRLNYGWYCVALTVIVLLDIDILMLEKGGDMNLVQWRFIDTAVGCLMAYLASVLIRIMKTTYPEKTV